MSVYFSLNNALKKIRGAQFFRLTYKVDVPVNENAEKQGATVQKVVSMTVRTGIFYGNLKEVREKNASNPNPVPANPQTWAHWVVENRVKEHNTTGEQYLVLYPTKQGTNTHTNYHIAWGSYYSTEIKPEEMGRYDYLKPTKPSKGGPVFMVNTKNIVAINGVPVYTDLVTAPVKK